MSAKGHTAHLMNRISVSRRRNNLDIYADILRIAKTGALKTHIVYRANLNFKIVKNYLSELLATGLLSFSSPLYFATEKADLFLNRYEALNRL